ncbi:MAG: hypothetical protein AMXMBFR67_29890 [Nitrospira sp.]
MEASPDGAYDNESCRRQQLMARARLADVFRILLEWAGAITT